jgi:hypothetical protein
MTRARLLFAATLVGSSLVAGTALAQATQAPLTPILSGKKFVAPLKGLAEVEFTKPVTKREKDRVVTRIQVKNATTAPIARLSIDETWYDKGGSIVAGGKGIIAGLLQPGEVQTVTIETVYNAKMAANNYNFAHANGTVKPRRVEKLAGPEAKEPAAKPAAAAKTPAKKN